MSILLAILSLLNPDPCKIGGLMQDDDRGLYIADPDRQDICAATQNTP